MAELPKRIASVILAMLFLFTSIGFSVFIIYQIATQDKTKTTTTPDQAQKTDLCEGSVVAEKLPKPNTYKPSGKINKLIVTDLQKGNGRVVKTGDCASVKYYGALSNGKLFQEDFTKPEGIKIRIEEGSAISGWVLGIPGMKVGGTRRLVIPPDLAYGDQVRQGIPANSTLVFVVKLLNIDK